VVYVYDQVATGLQHVVCPGWGDTVVLRMLPARH
jgi:hypothetical protein